MFLGFHQLHLDSYKIFKWFYSVLGCGEKIEFSQIIVAHNQEAYLFDCQSSVSVPRFEQKHLQVRFRGKQLVCVALFSWLQSWRNNHRGCFVSTYANELQIFLISKKKNKFLLIFNSFLFSVLGVLCRTLPSLQRSLWHQQSFLTSKSDIVVATNSTVWISCTNRRWFTCGFFSNTTPWWLAAGLE